jgi:hypothetical protein
MPQQNINYAMTAVMRKHTKTGTCTFTAKYASRPPAGKIFPFLKMFRPISE